MKVDSIISHFEDRTGQLEHGSSTTYFNATLARDVETANAGTFWKGMIIPEIWFDWNAGVCQFSDRQHNILAAFDLKVELVAR